MRYGRIPGIEKPASRIAQGTIMVGSDEFDRSARLLDTVLEGGVNMFDTAYVYGGGDNERCVGKWVNSRGVRDEVVILGKGGHPSGGESRCNPAGITKELNESLERFGFDYINLYVLHRDNPAVPVGEIVDVLNEHRRGLIHAFGGSNWTHGRIREANEYAKSKGLVPFAASSPQFSLAVMVKPAWLDCLSIAGPENAAARAWYEKTNIALVTWSSLARGFLSGLVTRANYGEIKESLEECMREAFCHPENFDRLDRANELAGEKGVPVAQIALAYVLNYPLNIFALVGPWTPEEFRSNLGALDLTLTSDELAWLNMERSGR